jgi:hypothetical protein
MSVIHDFKSIGQKCIVFCPEQQNVVEGTVQGCLTEPFQSIRYWIQPIWGSKEDRFIVSHEYVYFGFVFRRFLLKTEIVVNPYKGKRGIVLDTPCCNRAEHPDKYRVQFSEGREKHEAWFLKGELKNYREEYFEKVSLDDLKFKNLFREELKRYRQQRITCTIDGIPDYECDGEVFCNAKIEQLLDYPKFERAITGLLAR